MSAATETKEWLRPSMLPKLALCGHYRPEADAGEAAARGTKLDEVFRALIQMKNVNLSGLTDEEVEALRWAVSTAKALSGGHELEASEDALRVEALGLNGTADLLCEDAGWSADLKTGQKRNYVEQQAAYALGFMDRLFADEWTVYLLFCDQREVVTLRFTRESAEAAMRSALAIIRRAWASSATIPACDSTCTMVGIQSVSSPRYCAPPIVFRRSFARSAAARVRTSRWPRAATSSIVSNSTPWAGL